MVSTRIGISGWTYAPWRGTFYPKDLKQKNELHYASRLLNSIEINGTFYSMARPSSFAIWYDQTPPDFVFSIKGGRYITHLRRLRDIATPLANFFASGLLRLNEKMGPILWQFPPTFRFDAGRMASFFELLPRTTEAAARLAGKRDDWMKGRDWLQTEVERPIRYTVEIRHDSFMDERFVALLRQHDIALCVADTAGKWPFMEDVTSDFVYCRLHGDKQLYVSGYTDAALDAWAAKLRRWRSGREPEDATRVCAKSAPKRKSRDVFVYFDNDVKVRAPYDAMELSRRLGLTVGEPRAVNLSKVNEHPRTSWPPVPSRRARTAPTRGNRRATP